MVYVQSNVDLDVLMGTFFTVEDRNKDDDIMATSSTLSLKCPVRGVDWKWVSQHVLNVEKHKWEPDKCHFFSFCPTIAWIPENYNPNPLFLLSTFAVL